MCVSVSVCEWTFNNNNCDILRVDYEPRITSFKPQTPRQRFTCGDTSRDVPEFCLNMWDLCGSVMAVGDGVNDPNNPEVLQKERRLLWKNVMAV